ncbi:hypothetical protein V8C26DRAFT_221742 [Trichoderma gracile]
MMLHDDMCMGLGVGVSVVFIILPVSFPICFFLLSILTAFLSISASFLFSFFLYPPLILFPSVCFFYHGIKSGIPIDGECGLGATRHVVNLICIEGCLPISLSFRLCTVELYLGACSFWPRSLEFGIHQDTCWNYDYVFVIEGSLIVKMIVPHL